MSLWKKVDGANTADTVVTVTTTASSKTVTTASTSALVVGDAVSGTGIPAGATVIKVTNSTTFDMSVAATASGSPTATFVHKNVNKPKYTTVAEQANIFGVDANEAKLKPITHTGWVKVTSFSGARSGRKNYETLVAMGSMGLNTAGTAVTSDAEDSAFPDPTITISAQPTALTAVNYTAVTSGAPVVLGVTTSLVALGNTTTTYQWKVSTTGSAGTYTNVVNNANISGATTNTLTLKNKTQTTEFYKLTITATPPIGSPLTLDSALAQVSGGVLVSAGSWSTTATITATGHNLVSTDTAVVLGVTPSGYNTISTGAVMTVSGSDLNYASSNPGAVVGAPFTGLVFKYVA